jgi:hypothetical protein
MPGGKWRTSFLGCELDSVHLAAPSAAVFSMLTWNEALVAAPR